MRHHVFAVGVMVLLLLTLVHAEDRTLRPLSREGLITAKVPRRFQHPSPTATAAELGRLGDDYRSQKSYADAVDYYRAALSKTPDRLQQAELYNKIGISELQMEHLNEALKNFQRASRYNVNLAEAYNNAGAVLYFQKRYGKAIGEYKKALKLNDSDASFHVNIAAAYFSRKNYDIAIEEYKRAIELDPGILTRKSRTGVSAVLSAPEDHALYEYMLARLYAKSGAFDTSLRYLRKALEDGYKDMNNAYKDLEFTELRKDPRFADVMAGKPLPLPE